MGKKKPLTLAQYKKLHGANWEADLKAGKGELAGLQKDLHASLGPTGDGEGGMQSFAQKQAYYAAKKKIKLVQDKLPHKEKTGFRKLVNDVAQVAIPAIGIGAVGLGVGQALAGAIGGSAGGGEAAVTGGFGPGGSVGATISDAGTTAAEAGGGMSWLSDTLGSVRSTIGEIGGYANEARDIYQEGSSLFGGGGGSSSAAGGAPAETTHGAPGGASIMPWVLIGGGLVVALLFLKGR